MSRSIAYGVVIISVFVVAASAHAQNTLSASRALSDASALSVHGSGLIVTGSVKAIAAASQFTVASIATVADVSTIVLRDASSAAEVSLQIGSTVVGATSLAVGSLVHVVAETFGYALLHGGRVIAFVPNEIGAAMLHQSRQTHAVR